MRRSGAIPPRVTALVLNWNQPQDTLACLRSLAASDCSPDSTVVVDNGSTDDSVTRIRAAFPEVTLIEAGSNLGYCGGNNIGIRRALAEGAEYIWLLNDDTRVAPDALARLVEVAEAAPDAAFVGPKALMAEEPGCILSVGGSLAQGWRPQHTGLGEADDGQHDGIREVKYISGCALLARASAIRQIGLLDESFFAYHEDTDWCYRALRAGFRLLIEPRAAVLHPDTRRRDDASAFVTYYSTRNLLFFLRKHRLSPRPILSLLGQSALWGANWTVNPKWRHYRNKRDALVAAWIDFALGRMGRSERRL